MRIVKWIVGGLLVVILVVAVGGYIALSTLDLEQVRQLAERQAKEATGRDLKVAGPIDLKISLTPAISLSDVSFANADWGSRAEMVTLKSFDLEVAIMPLLSGAIEVNRLVLVEPDILLETNAEGKGNWELGTPAAADSQEAAPASGDGGGGAGGVGPIRIDVVAIENGKITYRDGATGQETRLALDQFDASIAGSSAPITLSLAGSYNDAPFKADGTLGSMDQLQSGPFPVAVTAEAGGAEITVNGSIAQPQSGQGIDLAITAKGDSLAGFSGFAGNPVPPLGPYDIAVKVGQNGDQITFSDLALTMGGSDLAGSGSLTMGAKPTVDGQFTSTLLDLADFQAGAAEGAGSEEAAADTSGGGTATGGSDSRYLFTEDPLPFDGLQAANANVKLQAQTLRLQPKMEMQDLDLTVVLTDGDLQIVPLNTGFAGGNIELEVGLNAAQAPARLTTKVLAGGIDYGQLLKDMEISQDVAGTLDVDVDLNGQGNSMREIASGLAGHLEMTSGEGTIDNRLLKLVAVGLGDITGPLFGGEKSARLNCIVTRFDVAQGLAQSKAILLDTEVFTLSGGGDVDLRDETLNLSFDTATREASIASLAVPFNVTGPMTDPSIAPDPLGTAAGVAKAAGAIAGGQAGALGALIGAGAGGGDSGGGNPCQVALAAIGQGSAPAGEPAAAPTQGGPAGAVEEVTKEAEDALKDAGEAIGGGIRKLFGD